MSIQVLYQPFDLLSTTIFIVVDHFCLERGRGIEPLTLAWKAKVIPFYEPRININMHIYDAVTSSGLHIHLSMMEEESFYIMVHDLVNFTMTMKFFNSVEPARAFIQSLE